jgi:RimJ/RimL family protein N-acetyltransferase
MFSLRRSTEADAEVVFRWRNTDYVRSTRLNKEFEDFQQHLSWWRRALVNSGVRLYMCLDERDVVVGHTKVIIRGTAARKDAEISVIIDPKFHGNGFGSKAIKLTSTLAFDTIETLRVIYALIKKDNVPSIKTFTKCRYALDRETMDHFVYYLSRSVWESGLK